MIADVMVDSVRGYDGTVRDFVVRGTFENKFHRARLDIIATQLRDHDSYVPQIDH